MKHRDMPFSRRSFLHSLALFGAGSAVPSLLTSSRLLAATTTQTGFKALVNIELEGGSDGNNLLIPIDNARYSLYSRARRNLAIDRSQLNLIDGHAAGSFGIHPSLTNSASLYQQGHAAIVANVGPLNQATSKQQFATASVAIPTDLMNHEKQRYQWATSQTLTGAAFGTSPGWGGLIADAMSSYNNGIFPMVTSLAPGTSGPIFCGGALTRAAVMAPGAAGVFPSDGLSNLQMISSLGRQGKLVSAVSGSLNDSLSQSAQISSILQGPALFRTAFPSSPLGTQLKQALQLIASHATLGMNRQIIECTAVGFDTHSNQMQFQGQSLSDLDASVGAFLNGLTEIGLQDNVVTFTTSDFGRTLAQNSTDGSDHAWGNHLLVFGTALKGGQVFGSFPDLTPNGNDDIDGQGRWIPTLSVDQYGATLATWFGVDAAVLPSIFPHLSNFTQKNLGFC